MHMVFNNNIHIFMISHSKLDNIENIPPQFILQLIILYNMHNCKIEN